MRLSFPEYTISIVWFLRGFYVFQSVSRINAIAMSTCRNVTNVCYCVFFSSSKSYNVASVIGIRMYVLGRDLTVVEIR